jgi:hypothetical protein
MRFYPTNELKDLFIILAANQHTNEATYQVRTG